MNFIANALVRLGIMRPGLDYHLIRASMVIAFMFFGYQRWFNYAAQFWLQPIANHPPISWVSPAFGLSEWLFGALLLAGYWNKKSGILGAIGSALSRFALIAAIPFTSAGWAAPASGFYAMTTNVACLIKDLVLLAVSIYLLRQDVMRVSLSATVSALELGRADQIDLERLAVALQIWSWNNRRTLTVQKDT
jgi:uncharacterized membrane protein YkgB